MRRSVGYVELLAGEGGVREVPGRVLSTRLCPSHSLLFRVARRLVSWSCVVGVPLCHVPAHREQVLRDIHHPHDLCQQPVAGRMQYWSPPQITHLTYFLPARRYASAVFAVIACPSVRPSQVGVMPKRINVYRITQTTPHDRPRTLIVQQ